MEKKMSAINEEVIKCQFQSIQAIEIYKTWASLCETPTQTL